MKKVLINTFRIVTKAVLACALFVCTWWFLTPYFRKDHNIEGDAFRNLPEQVLDVIALGSSHMQYAFEPAVFYTESGWYSYVMGTQCQPMSITYHMLEEVLKTQSPEVAFIDVFTLLPASSVCYADGNFYVAIDEMTGKNRLEAADTVENEELREQYRFDLLMNHSNWKTMDFSDPAKLLKANEPYGDYNYELGFVRQEPSLIRPSPLIVYERKEVLSLSDKEKKEIDDIIALCKEHGVTPVFLKTPFICDRENTDKLYAVWDYLEEKNVRYVDLIAMAEEMEWYLDMDGDAWHNNSWGAEIVTKQLAKIAAEEGLVTRHKENETMEYLCNNMRKISAKSLLGMNNIDIYRLLEYAAKYPCSVIVRYQGKDRTSITERANALLQGLGTDHDFITDMQEDYYGWFLDGKLQKEASEPFSIEYGGSKVDITYNEILVDGVGQDPDPGELEIYFTADNFEWLNAIGINYASRWFWELSCEGYDCIARCGW